MSTVGIISELITKYNTNAVFFFSGNCVEAKRFVILTPCNTRWISPLLPADVKVVQQLAHDVIEEDGGYKPTQCSDGYLLPVLHVMDPNLTSKNALFNWRNYQSTKLNLLMLNGKCIFYHFVSLQFSAKTIKTGVSCQLRMSRVLHKNVEKNINTYKLMVLIFQVFLACYWQFQVKKSSSLSKCMALERVLCNFEPN